ncbi:MAG: Gfo/Idh/MocA family oxidoreductase [Candidatus Melainabacteria bacterium]|nr:Gfo/Idh/MocA family oxidoreductase [Candidatus Melainabacteria bacterium]
MELPKVAVIGCGNWGKNLVRNFAHLQTLTVVCDSDSGQLDRIAAEFKGVRVTTSFESVLEDKNVSAIVVATPSDTHFELAKKSLIAGKHVYVEKPLARDVKHCEELDELANERNLVLMVGHLLLYHPAVNCLKELIAAGELGDLLFVRSDRMNFNMLRSHWSVLWDLAPHDLSMMSYLLDCDAPEVTRVGGWDTQNDGLVDVAYLDVSFPVGANGRVIPGQVRNSWIDPQKLVRLTVNGTKKTAVLNDTQIDDKLALHSLSMSAAGRMTTVIEHPYYPNIEPLHLECEHFLQCIVSGERPRSDANNAYHVVKVLSDVEKRLSARPRLQAPTTR